MATALDRVTSVKAMNGWPELGSTRRLGDPACHPENPEAPTGVQLELSSVSRRRVPLPALIPAP